jgi:hypothetical protein
MLTKANGSQSLERSTRTVAAIAAVNTAM